MPLYIGTPYKIEGKIEPRASRNAKGVQGRFIFASPHRNAAMAYAFKPTHPQLARSPLLVSELLQNNEGQNPYVMIIAADHNLYLRGLALVGHLYTVPAAHSFRAVASQEGEHISTDALATSRCSYETVALPKELGKSFHILFANPNSPKLFKLIDTIAQQNPLSEHGRLLLDEATMSQAVSESILYKVPNQEILSAASRQ